VRADSFNEQRSGDREQFDHFDTINELLPDKNQVE
jgi:hypothetical protein